MKNANKPLKVKVVDDQLIISIGVSTLAYALQNGPNDFCARIANEKGFAKDVAKALENDSSSATLYSGNTMVQDLLSRAAEEAIEAGSKHIQLDGESGPSVYPSERS